MKVKLIQVTQNPIDVMWTAARTCYSAKSPIEIWSNDRFPNLEENDIQREERLWKLVKKVIDSSHTSICEHVYFTFAIEGISRACSHQLVRHRAGIVFSQQSQRYVEIKENIDKIQNLRAFPVSDKDKAIEICSQYFVDVNENNYNGYVESLWQYLNATNNGVKPEDARMFLPNATKTNITMSINLRELMHVSNLRLCARAQLEIRQLFQAIKKEVEVQDKRLASLLAPSCEVHGFCTEHQCCGRKPKLEEVLEDSYKYKDLSK